MGRRKTHEENIRKITKSGSSYALTIPIALMRELEWQEKQRVVVEKKGKTLLIKDYK